MTSHEETKLRPVKGEATTIEASPESSPPSVAEPVPSTSTPSDSPSRHAGASVAVGAPIREGLFVYLGTSDTGKTYSACKALEAKHAATKRPALAIDSAATPTLAHLEHAKSLHDALRALWGPDRKLVRWTPKDENEFDAMMRACLDPGGVDVLVDELSFWAKRPLLLRLCRVWRQADVTLHVTCQHIGADLAQSVLGVNPVLYIYRVTAPRSLDMLELWLNEPREKVLAQVRGQFIERRF